MPSTDDYRNIYQSLSNMYGTDMAFYAIEDNKKDNHLKVWFATSENGWSCITLALQDMASAYNLAAGEGLPLCIGAGAERTGAAQGMLRFFNTPVVDSQILAQPETNRNRRKTYTAYKIHPYDILQRQQLDEFLNLQLNDIPMVELQLGQQSSHLHRLYMALAFRRVRYKISHNEHGLPIAAVLVDASNGEVRVLAHNTKDENCSFHAEVNLVQAFHKRFSHEYQRPFILYSTLQPCPMCAAMIAQYLPMTKVFYGQSDLGLHMERMETQPQFCRPLQGTFISRDNGTTQQVPVKPLRGWRFVFDNNHMGWVKTNNDIGDELNSTNNALRNQYQSKSKSLTRNLYKNLLSEKIERGARTLDRKRGQYLFGGKQINVPGDLVRTQRRTDIQRVIWHIQALITGF